MQNRGRAWGRPWGVAPGTGQASPEVSTTPTSPLPHNRATCLCEPPLRGLHAVRSHAPRLLRLLRPTPPALPALSIPGLASPSILSETPFHLRPFLSGVCELHHAAGFWCFTYFSLVIRLNHSYHSPKREVWQEPCFIKEETELRKVEELAQSHTASEQEPDTNQTPNPDVLATRPHCYHTSNHLSGQALPDWPYEPTNPRWASGAWNQPMCLWLMRPQTQERVLALPMVDPSPSRAPALSHAWT